MTDEMTPQRALGVLIDKAQRWAEMRDSDLGDAEDGSEDQDEELRPEMNETDYAIAVLTAFVNKEVPDGTGH